MLSYSTLLWVYFLFFSMFLCMCGMYICVYIQVCEENRIWYRVSSLVAFLLIYGDRISNLNPELINLASPVSQLVLGSKYWDYRWAAIPMQHRWDSGVFFIFLILFVFFSVLSACISVWGCPILGNWSYYSCQLPCGFWELDWGLWKSNQCF